MLTKIRPAVLGGELAGERVVVVGLELCVAAHLEVAVRVLQIKQEQAALRALLEVAGLQTRAVERRLELAVIVQEPNLGELGKAVAADRRERRDLRVQEV